MQRIVRSRYLRQFVSGLPTIQHPRNTRNSNAKVGTKQIGPNDAVSLNNLNLVCGKRSARVKRYPLLALGRHRLLQRTCPLPTQTSGFGSREFTFGIVFPRLDQGPMALKQWARQTSGSRFSTTYLSLTGGRHGIA